MRFTIFQESRIGKRRTNQDRVAYSYTRDALLMVLADGMGGHLYGEIAAQISVQFIAQSFQQEARPKVSDPVLFLSRVLSNAHHAILDYAFDKHLTDIPRTTVVACLTRACSTPRPPRCTPAATASSAAWAATTRRKSNSPAASRWPMAMSSRSAQTVCGVRSSRAASSTPCPTAASWKACRD